MKWVSVKDQLPENDETILFIVENDSKIEPGYFSSECFREDKKVAPPGKKYKTLDVYRPGFVSAYDNSCCYDTIRFGVDRVTHWLPLSEITLPKD
jgi:hypothetical protein